MPVGVQGVRIEKVLVSIYNENINNTYQLNLNTITENRTTNNHYATIATIQHCNNSTNSNDKKNKLDTIIIISQKKMLSRSPYSTYVVVQWSRIFDSPL